MVRISIVAMLLLGSPTAELLSQAQQSGRLVVLSATSDVKTLLASEQDRLQVVTISASNAVMAKYVPADDVVGALTAGKTQLVARLSTEELAGLRAYTSIYYPANPRMRLILATGVHQDSLAPTLDAVNAFADANIFIGKIESAALAPIDLDVATEPPQATFALRPEFGGGLRTTVSDGALPNVYRGLYVYTVSRPGYKSVEGKMNLVDESATRVHCRLVPTSSPAAPQPCAVR